MIKQTDAQFLWGTVADDTTITWLKIINITKQDEPKAQAALEASSGSAGADTAGWLTDPHPQSQPMGIFADLFFHYGFVDKTAEKAALREFANVEEWQWARDMVQAIEYKDASE